VDEIRKAKIGKNHTHPLGPPLWEHRGEDILHILLIFLILTSINHYVWRLTQKSTERISEMKDRTTCTISLFLQSTEGEDSVPI
jgi:hypothetical protein